MNWKFTSKTRPVINSDGLRPDGGGVLPDGERPAPKQGSNRLRRLRQTIDQGRRRRLGRARFSRRLSEAEEIRLSKRIKQGDSVALKRLVIANLALVVRAVRDYGETATPREDLLQEGNLALIRAALAFDPSAHPARFTTYARFWIQAALVRAAGSGRSLVRPHDPARARRRARRRRALRGLAGKNTAAADSAFAKRSASQRAAARRWRELSWSALRHASQNFSRTGLQFMVEHELPPDRDVEDAENRAIVHAALEQLNPFEAWIIRERFGLIDAYPASDLPASEPRKSDADTGRTSFSDLPGAAPKRFKPRQTYYQRTYGEIGAACGLSVTRIRDIEHTALEKLRSLLAPVQYAHRFTLVFDTAPYTPP
jgi:RNA polymerase primary sigma factor